MIIGIDQRNEFADANGVGEILEHKPDSTCCQTLTAVLRKFPQSPQTIRHVIEHVNGQHTIEAGSCEWQRLGISLDETPGYLEAARARASRSIPGDASIPNTAAQCSAMAG